LKNIQFLTSGTQPDKGVGTISKATSTPAVITTHAKESGRKTFHPSRIN
jgi:hypothetical protein